MQILIVASDSYFAQCDNEYHSFLLETSYRFIFLNRKIKHFIIKKFRIQKSQLKKSILSVMYLCVYTHIRCIIFKYGIILTLHSYFNQLWITVNAFSFHYVSLIPLHKWHAVHFTSTTIIHEVGPIFISALHSREQSGRCQVTW